MSVCAGKGSGGDEPGRCDTDARLVTPPVQRERYVVFCGARRLPCRGRDRVVLSIGGASVRVFVPALAPAGYSAGFHRDGRLPAGIAAPAGPGRMFVGSGPFRLPVWFQMSRGTGRTIYCQVRPIHEPRHVESAVVGPKSGVTALMRRKL